MPLTFIDRTIIRNLINAEAVGNHATFLAVYAALLRVYGLPHTARLESIAHRVCRRTPSVAR